MPTDERIPLSLPSLGDAELKYVQACLEENWVAGPGRFVTAFERAFAEYHGRPNAVSTINGTAALHLAMVELGLGPGDEVIVPARESGVEVVCDRFSDSSIAYQGIARGLGADKVESLCDIATGGIWPDITFFLRLHPEVAAERIAAEGRAADRFEGEGLDLQKRVAEGYEEVAARHPARIKVIDASRDPDEIHDALVAELGRVRA